MAGLVPDLTFGRIAINERALCIECKMCGRRSGLKKTCPHLPGFLNLNRRTIGGYELVPEIWKQAL